uniref:Large polyvalent protein associated domain-containing protein n=1 Tax=viral metagenome TaxID=1070528 RepID=A0A6C0JWQ2_9ZZZZ
MAFMNQAKKKIIAELVKPILKKYNLKGSLSVKHYSSIVLTLKSGKIDFIKNYNDNAIEKNQSISEWQRKKDSIDVNYMQVNEFYINENYTGIAREALNALKSALQGADWYDKSEIQEDYFDIAYYIDINIGKYDQGYIVE